MRLLIIFLLFPICFLLPACSKPLPEYAVWKITECGDTTLLYPAIIVNRLPNTPLDTVPIGLHGGKFYYHYISYTDTGGCTFRLMGVKVE